MFGRVQNASLTSTQQTFTCSKLTIGTLEPQLTFTGSKSTIETLAKDVKYIQS